MITDIDQLKNREQYVTENIAKLELGLRAEEKKQTQYEMLVKNPGDYTLEKLKSGLETINGNVENIKNAILQDRNQLSQIVRDIASSEQILKMHGINKPKDRIWIDDKEISITHNRE